MELISINTGVPQLASFGGITVETGIFKRPVSGRIALGKTNLEGDRQADLSVHGGRDKAVYAYPDEHYSWWSDALDREDLSPGQFGENFTVQGMLEDEVCIGDVFQIGSATVEVSQPRSPCGKLGIRMKMREFPKLFMASGRCGFYLRVLETGDVGAGDSIVRLRRDPFPISVHTMFQTFHVDRGNLAAAREALTNVALADDWRKVLNTRVAKQLDA